MSESTLAERYGSTALVAGAASGIGFEFLRSFVAQGLDVIALDHDAGALDEACASLVDQGPGQALPAVVDLAAANVVAQVQAAVGAREIGLFVYCAASIPFGRFVGQDFDSHDRAVAVNCRGPVLLSRLFAAEMAERGRGGIILLASMAAYQGNGWVATYAGTKAFNLILAESLWWELRGDGVDVLGLAPGATDTKGMRASGSSIPEGMILADPKDVVLEGLEALGRRPSHVCGEDNRKLRKALNEMDHETAIDLMSGGTRALCGD
ncbi:MAG: short-subunit dehydrogenase [Hyphomicrobiaceae bacterium]|jgi:short-subunit dehydrogenase